MSFKKLFKVNTAPRPPKTECFVTQIGAITLNTTIIFMERRTVTISLNVVKDELIFKAPHGFPNTDIQRFIKEKESWIIRKLAEGKRRNENYIPREFTHGSKHLLVGKEFTLNVIISNKRISPVFDEETLTIHAKNDEKIKYELFKWYTIISPRIFGNITTPIISDFFIKYSKSPRSIEYKYVTSYWGICSSKGEIKLNIELLRAPKKCIEYIIAHELCHLIHQNHSADFYKLLSEFMPDWKERKQLLDKTITCK